MAKKNPNSPEWIARCVDAAAAFTDGSKMTGENMYKPVWDLYITIPRFFGMGEENAKEWNKNIRNMLNSIGRLLLDSSPTKYGRVQYHIIGQGSFKSFEDTILKLYDTPAILPEEPALFGSGCLKPIDQPKTSISILLANWMK